MASKPDLSLPVHVEGALHLEAPTGRTLELRADGDMLHVDVPGWPELRAAMPGSSRARKQSLNFIAQSLAACGVTLSLESGGQTFCRLGHGVNGNWLARLLGLGPASVSIGAIRLFLKR